MLKLPLHIKALVFDAFGTLFDQKKPIPSVYQLAPQALTMPASEIDFVSSNTWDICGAKSFCLFTIWLNRNNAPMEELGYSADIEINSLNSLI